jgi:glutaredoxin 3
MALTFPPRSAGRDLAHVEIYSSPWCPYCWLARWLLKRKGVAYQIRPIRFYLGIKLPTRNFRDMVERTDGDSTIPQIFVDGRYLGTDDTLQELESLGRLDDALRGGSPRAEG